MNAFLDPAHSPTASRDNGRRGFTLVEILVSMGVLSILLLISAQVIGQVQTTWTSSTARTTQFREARTAFDILTRNLSQATLNTYIDYNTNYLQDAAAVATAAPDSYQRNSDLRFVCGPSASLIGGSNTLMPGHAIFFQAPLGVVHAPEFAGLDRLLCGRGYFVQFSSDESFRPGFLPPGHLRYRYRLMEFSPPAERNEIYSSPTASGWFAAAGDAVSESETAIERSLTRPVADNILTLIISPQLEKPYGGTGPVPTSIAPAYAYDSVPSGDPGSPGGTGTPATRHLLPPLVRVVLVAIDERAAERLAGLDESGEPPLQEELASAGFTSAAALEADVAQLETALRARKINYRVFSATIMLRTAKWSGI